MMKVAVIYAVAENNVIGNDNALPWHLPADLKHFKQKTTGKPIVMGRKTFDSIGKPLPNRRNIVVTNNKSWHNEGVEVAHSLQDALSMCEGEPEVCVIGGAQLFRQAFDLGIVTDVYLTRIHADIEGDTYFELPADFEKVVSVASNQSDEKNPFAYTFLDIQKKD